MGKVSLANDMRMLANLLDCRSSKKATIEKLLTAYANADKQVSSTDVQFVIREKGLNEVEAATLIMGVSQLGLGKHIIIGSKIAEALAEAAGMVVTCEKILEGGSLADAPEELQEQGRTVLKSLKKFVKLLNAEVKDDPKPPEPEEEKGK